MSHAKGEPVKFLDLKAEKRLVKSSTQSKRNVPVNFFNDKTFDELYTLLTKFREMSNESRKTTKCGSKEYLRVLHNKCKKSLPLSP